MSSTCVAPGRCCRACSQIHSAPSASTLAAPVSTFSRLDQLPIFSPNGSQFSIAANATENFGLLEGLAGTCGAQDAAGLTAEQAVDTDRPVEGELAHLASGAVERDTPQGDDAQGGQEVAGVVPL